MAIAISPQAVYLSGLDTKRITKGQDLNQRLRKNFVLQGSILVGYSAQWYTKSNLKLPS